MLKKVIREKLQPPKNTPPPRASPLEPVTPRLKFYFFQPPFGNFPRPLNPPLSSGGGGMDTLFMIHNEGLNFHEQILYSLLYSLQQFSQQDRRVKINGVIYQWICDV